MASNRFEEDEKEEERCRHEALCGRRGEYEPTPGVSTISKLSERSAVAVGTPLPSQRLLGRAA